MQLHINCAAALIAEMQTLDSCTDVPRSVHRWIQAWADRTADPPLTKSRGWSWLREAVCLRRAILEVVFDVVIDYECAYFSLNHFI